MQCLKNGLEFNVSEGSVSLINPISTDLFWPRNRWQGVGVKFFLDRQMLFIGLKLGTHAK